MSRAGTGKTCARHLRCRPGAGGQRLKKPRGTNRQRWGLKQTAGHIFSPEAFGASLL